MILLTFQVGVTDLDNHASPRLTIVIAPESPPSMRDVPTVFASEKDLKQGTSSRVMVRRATNRVARQSIRRTGRHSIVCPDDHAAAHRSQLPERWGSDRWRD